MGQYWIPVNLDKREFINPHRLGNGLKLGEQVCSHPGTGAALLILCAAMPVRRGGGDLDLEENWHGPERKIPPHNVTPGPMPEAYPDIAKRTIGRWAGDRVALVGDYAEDSDLPAEFEASKIYARCLHPADAEDPEYMERLRQDGITEFYTDVTEDVCAVIEHELRGCYIGDGWRQFVDVPRNEIWEPGEVLTLMRNGHAFAVRKPGVRNSQAMPLPDATELEILDFSVYHFRAKIVACSNSRLVGTEVFVDRDQLPRGQTPFAYMQDIVAPRRDEETAFVVTSPNNEAGYVVSNPLSENASCTCPDWRYRKSGTGEPCKHIAEFRRKAGV